MEKYIFITLIALSVLILLVQIITDVIKMIVKDNKYYNAVVLGVSIVLTISAVIIACIVMKLAVTWYIILGAFVISFLVAYGAMLGYDKLFKRVFTAVKEAVNSFGEMKTESEGK